jgi:hypothetical protein
VKSRYFTIVDVPEPKNLKVDFIYNFFVSDEKINDSGDLRISQDPAYYQKLVDTKSIKAEVPRYVEISFEPVNLQINNYLDAGAKNVNFTNFLEKIDSEETITNDGFASISDADRNARQRIKQKIDAVSKVFGVKFSDSEQSKKISQYLGVKQSDVQSIITPLNEPKKLLVNQLPKFSEIDDIFDKASFFKLSAQVNKRLAGVSVNSADDVSPLSKVSIEKQIKKKSAEFVSLASQGSLNIADIEPVIQPIEKISTEKDVKLLGASAVGYIINRKQINNDGTPIPDRNKTFYLRGSENTRYIDTQVLYGSYYTYQVRAIFRIDAILDDGGENSQVAFLVASKTVTTKILKTEEYEPPNEPDGVFYTFNYDAEKGLVIRWQIPSGRSRDTKYFQVFRRKTIYEPFVCIAQLDFDDSVLRTSLNEQVRKDRVYYSNGPVTFFEDKSFKRDSKYIYAVSAIDAHGYSSGYSVQTEVGFDRMKNSLTLRMISRAGAPKQYPNFYVDPRLDDNIAVDSFSQDALLDSGHKKIEVYFTPDAKVMATSEGFEESVFLTDQSSASESQAELYGSTVSVENFSVKGSYFLHIINIDLQKSSQVKIGIDDLRKNL